MAFRAKRGKRGMNLIILEFLKIKTNKIRDLFKVKLYTIISETKEKKRERERERVKKERE